MKKTNTLIFMILLAFSPLFAEGVLVITNPSNPANELSKGDLKKIYTGKKGSWDDGTPIKAMDQKFENPVAAKFIKQFVGKNVDDYQSFWMEQMLSGAATPPESSTDDAEVIDYVKKTKGAIGYVKSANESVKVLQIK